MSTSALSMSGQNGFDSSTFMMQNTVVNSASKLIATGIWWLDMVVLIMVMSVVGSLFQNLPMLLSDIKYRISGYFTRFKRKLVKENELQLVDQAYIDSKSNYVFRPEFRNSMYLVKAMEYYLNKEKDANLIQVDLDNDGQGNNDYHKMKDHSVHYRSCDPVTVLNNGVTVTYSKDVALVESGTRLITTKITLLSNNTHEFLKEFVEQVYKEYVEKYFKKFDNDRQLHYYTLDVEKSFSMFGSEKSAKKELSCWRRYNLEVNRTFASLFFDEKETVLKLINNFLNKTGMFGKESIPYKMTFMLHGPPGTGKTSFIKALANMTRRHVVNVALPLIETNGQLLDIFHNEDIAFFDNWAKREDSIPLDKRIYVLEDIDALSKIVQIRKTNKTNKSAEIVTKVKKVKKTKDDDTSSDSDDTEVPETTAAAKPTGAIGPVSMVDHEKYAMQSDELNLSGLLNALDGLLELTGAIVVLTTNHPENLDPALIRPGRVTKKMELGCMSSASIHQMISYYFSDYNQSIMESICPNSLLIGITPAKLENICMNCNSAAEIYEQISKLQKVE